MHPSQTLLNSLERRSNKMDKKDLYKTITETVPEFFFIYNLLQKKVTFVSPQFYELAEPHQDAPHHGGLRSYIHPEDQSSFDAFFEELSKENQFTSRTELRAHRDLGNIKWVEINTFPVEDGEKEVDQVVGHIVDITEKKERISLLEDEQEKLDNVLKILAHDLRAPFSQVHMIADILQNMMGEEEQKRYGMYISMLKHLGKRSLNLLDSLLRLVALQEGTLSLNLKKHDLRDILHNVTESYRLSLEEKDISCIIKAPDFAVVTEVDDVLLEQALSNLLSNAVKFTPDGGTIEIRIFQRKKNVFIEVEDNGIGIPENHMPDLFKEFSKIRRKGLKGEKSTGLGLAISQQIIRLHKGKISVKSQEEKGTLFTIKLPLL